MQIKQASVLSQKSFEYKADLFRRALRRQTSTNPLIRLRFGSLIRQKISRFLFEAFLG